MKFTPQNIITWIISHRLHVLLVIILFTIASLSQLNKVSVYNEVGIWIEQSSPEYANYMDFTKEFGNDESIILFYHSDSLTTNHHLKIIRAITDSLSSVKGVNKVISLATVYIPSSSIFGPRMIPLMPVSVSHPERLKERFLKYVSLRDYLVSYDCKTTSFTILVDSGSNKEDMLATVSSLASKVFNDDGEFVVYGIVSLKEELRKLSANQSKRFLFVAIAMILLINFLLFRRIKEMVLPVLIAGLSIVWILGLMALLKVTMNMVISVMPIILLVISIAYSIHFIFGQAKAADNISDSRDALISNFKTIFKSCFLSAITTAIALLAFTISDITPLKNFGLFAGTGVLISFVITFTLLPVYYSFDINRPEIPEYLGNNRSRLEDLSNFTFSHSKIIYLLSLIIFLFSVAGISKLKINTDQVGYFKKNDPISISNDKASTWFKGILPIEMVFKVDTNMLENPGAYFDSFSLLEDSLMNIPEIVSWQSPVLILKDYGLIKNGRPVLPKISGDMSPGSGEILSHFISPDGRALRITLRTSWLNDRQVLDLMKKVESSASNIFIDTGVKFYFTGSVPVFANLSSRLVKSQIRSIIISFILILLLFIIIYRSLKVAIACLIPNILPVACTLGIMGFSNIPLDVATVLIASVSFGIAIDDTVHFVNSYTRAIIDNNSREALKQAYAGVGKPIIVTSLLIISGFMIMAFSSYKPIIYLGVFISVNILLALAYDLFLLPNVLVSWKIWNKDSGR